MNGYHKSVLLDESVSALNIRNGGIYVDVTLGGGGHSREILKRMGKESKLVVFDKDADALQNIPDDDRVCAVHNNFRFMYNNLRYKGFEMVDGILADLGVSSHQFDTEERGFSFRFNATLDMRMNQKAGTTAEKIVNEYDLSELTRLFAKYGELTNSRNIANLLTKARMDKRIVTTNDLNEALLPVTPSFAGHKFLAKVYQALRIEVNGEMRALEGFLNDSKKALKSGGRLVVITYHSLEDRIVKNFFRSGNCEGDIEKDFYGNYNTPFKLVSKKPITPSEEEIASNTRARSAKLRIAEMI